MSEQRRQRGGGQAGGLLLLSPAASPGQVEACRLWGWSEGVGLRGLEERQALITCRVPSLSLRGPVALGWGVPGRAMGHDPQQEQALLAVAGGWEPSCSHMPRHTQNDSTLTQPEPQLCIHACVHPQSHTQAASRWMITQPRELTVIRFKTALGPHRPPHSQAAPQKPHAGATRCPSPPPRSNATVTRGSSDTCIPPESHNTVTPRHQATGAGPGPGPVTAPSECPPPSSTRCTLHT